jgi:hypothetical protein
MSTSGWQGFGDGWRENKSCCIRNGHWLQWKVRSLLSALGALQVLANSGLGIERLLASRTVEESIDSNQRFFYTAWELYSEGWLVVLQDAGVFLSFGVKGA